MGKLELYSKQPHTRTTLAYSRSANGGRGRPSVCGVQGVQQGLWLRWIKTGCQLPGGGKRRHGLHSRSLTLLRRSRFTERRKPVHSAHFTGHCQRVQAAILAANHSASGAESGQSRRTLTAALSRHVQVFIYLYPSCAWKHTSGAVTQHFAYIRDQYAWGHTYWE